jgi:uncharacterized protein (TIGR02246 family)
MHVHLSNQFWKRLLLVGAWLALASATSAAAQPSDGAGDPAGQLVKEYVRAWNARDFAALERLWAEDGEFINSQGVSVDRNALLESKTTGAEGSKAVIDVTVSSKPRMLEPNVAMFEGESALATTDGAVFERMQFAGILVKRDDKWQIRLIRELSSERPAPGDPLRELSWMVGDWVGIGQNVRVHIATNWEMDRRYLVSHFEFVPENGEPISATQRIGWDPATRSIKSWYFDSLGSISSGSWKQDGDNWFVKIHGTQYDGQSMSGTSVVTPVDADSYLRTMGEMHVGGRLLPDLELRVFRVGSETTE